MKIKCPSCDKSYRTYDAIITHFGQTGCINKTRITKKLLDSIDETLREKIIRNKLKKLTSDISLLEYRFESAMEEGTKYKQHYLDISKQNKFDFRILNRLVLSLYDID